MRVDIIEPSGYCAGVAKAFDIAREVRKNNKDKNIVVLGMLVHNQDALKELDELNIQTMYKKDMSYVDMVDMLSSDDIVILTAHGHPLEVEKKLQERGIKYYDATCPFVKLAHEQIKKAVDAKHQVIYIGKKNHPEALSALSLSNDVLLYEIKDGMDPSLVRDESPLLLSQTTFSKLDVNEIEKDLKKKIPSLRFAPSVCNASNSRQEALLNIEKDVDGIIVVGGKESNNTKTLYELALANYPNKKVLYIQNQDDLSQFDSSQLNHIVIISGTSTPRYILDTIKTSILSK